MPVDLLDDIRQLFQDGDEQDALDLLDAYLAEHPDDCDADLLKIEFSLAANVNAAYIGAALARLSTACPDSERVQQLRDQVEERVRARLDEGRRELRGRYRRDARACFDAAVDLAPDDPAVPLAAALALLHTESSGGDDDEDQSPLAILEALLNEAKAQASGQRDSQIDEYLLRVLKIGAPDHPAVMEAAECLIRRRLDAGDIGGTLDLLGTLSVLSERIVRLTADIPQRAVVVALGRAALFLRAASPDQAGTILERCLAAAPDLALVHLLYADAHVLDGDGEAALKAYERALALSTQTPDQPPLEQAKTAWEQAQSARLICPHCGKVTKAETPTCDFCDRPVGEHHLLIDRYQLEGTSEAVVAHIGLAEQLAAQDVLDTALDHLDAALAKLPTGHKAGQALRTLRGEWLMNSQRLSEQEPPVQSALNAWRQGGLTPEVILQVRHLCDTDPAAWADAPLDERESLACALVKAGQLAQAQTFLRVALDGIPAEDLRADLDAAVGERIDDVMVQMRQALVTHHPEQALALSEIGLALRPGDAALRLLRAETLHALGNPLAALALCRGVLDHAADESECEAARLGIALALEARRELDAACAAIEGLEGPAVQAVRARIARRQAGDPVVCIREAAEVVMHDTLERVPTAPYYAGFFAVTIGAVRRPWEGGGWNEHILAAGLEFTQTLGGLRHQEGDPVFALRLIAFPDARIPERGRLTVALLARVSAPEADACRTLALDLWGTLRTILPLTQDFVYSFEPVVDETALEAMLEPFEPVTLAEIVRREDVPQRDGDRYAVYPFTPGSFDLHNLCWTLLRQPAPALVSIHLLPTDLMPWETAALDRVMLGAPYLASEEAGHLSMNDPVWQWWQGAQLWGQAQTNRRLVDTLRAQAYVMGVTVAGSAGTSPLLPEVVAATLFGPLRTEGEATRGGYDVVRAARADEVAAARRNLAHIDVERWTYTAAPDGVTRLHHLVGEGQAALAFRLPIPGAHGIPGLPSLEVKPISPPVNLPETGTVLGESVVRLSGLPLRITQGLDDRRRHTYIVGKTGTGKSTLIKYMALQDIEAGHGVCVIDPHGDLAEDILNNIPAHRINDVIVFDPSDEERPVGLNLLQASSEAEKHRIVTEFIGLLVRMYDPGQTGIVGPRFQHNVRNAMLTVMAVEGSTMIEVVRALTDSGFVRNLLPHVNDPLVRNYWEKQIANTSDFHKSEILDYIVSKFSRFVGDQLVRNIVGQRETTIDFRQVMDRRQVLLVNLSKGKIGPESAQFLGLLLVQRLLLTALSRADVPPDQRPDFFLYVDEFQNFATELFATVLSEGRKYGVAVTVANQYLTQLDRAIREAIFGNVGSLISFRLGTQDAAALAPELYPVFDADDLLNLPKFTTCVKLLVDGLASRPFTMQTVLDSRAPNLSRPQRISAA